MRRRPVNILRTDLSVLPAAFPGTCRSTHHSVLRNAAAGMLLLLTAVGCTFDYQDADAGQGRELPDYTLTRTMYRIARSGEDMVVFSAERLEMFNDLNRAVLYEASFTIETGAAENNPTGSCRQASIHTGSRNAELSGHIVISAPEEDLTLTAETLTWNNRSQTLSSDTDEVVSIIYGDGSIVRGTGFNGDFTLAEVTFLKILEGELQYE